MILEMNLDDMIKGVCDMLCCCENRAVSVIATRVNNGEKEKLKKEILDFMEVKKCKED